MDVNKQHNKVLYLLSLLSIIFILIGLYYGYTITQTLTLEKENFILHRKIDSLTKIIRK